MERAGGCFNCRVRCYVLAACGVSGCAVAVDSKTDDTRPVEIGSVGTEVRGGTVVTGAIGVVDYFLSAGIGTSSPSAQCTGTMIAPNVVLTAAHCFDSLGAKTSSGGSSPFTIRYYDPEDGIRIVFSGTATWSVLPSYNGTGPTGPGGSNDDLAAIEIPTRFVGTTYHDYMRVYSDVGSALQNLSFFGAGRYTYSNATDNNLRTTWFDVESVEDWHIVVDTRDQVGICKGDSGGPFVYNASSVDGFVPLIAAVASKMETDNDDEGSVCTNNDPPNDDAFGCRTRGPRMDWVESQTGIECKFETGISKDYQRCFKLPLVEDIAFEGLEQGVGASIAIAIL